MKRPVTNKLPTKVKIGFKTYKVDFAWESQEHDGFCNNDIPAIYIDKDVKEGAPRGEVFLHEVLHGIFHMHGIDTNMSDEEEEQLVNTIGLALTTVIKNNPTAMRWLIKEVTKKNGH